MTQPQRQQDRKPQLAFAVRALRAAIDRLIAPTAGYINNTYVEEPGLYLQLFTALDSYRSNAASSPARSRPPVWIEAAEQLNNIDLMVSIWQHGDRGGPTTIARLKALATQHWTPEDLRKVRRLTNIINAWADDIHTLLNDEHRYITGAACPVCLAETVQRRDSAGELVRSPALKISIEHGCICQNTECGHYWAPNKFIDLCRELGMELPAGVLE